jgi:DNA polymerase III delta subunit
MKLHELQKQIVSKKLDKVYVFTGEEIGIMDIYLDKIYSIVGCDVVRMESVQEAYAKMTQRRISGAPRCFVVRDDKEFLKQDKIWDTVFLLADKSPDYLILIYSSMDKRSKFYKRNTEMLTEFEKLSPEMLAKYIRKELPGMKERDAYKLAEICECNYSRILLECDKIRHYVHSTQKSGIVNGVRDEVVDFGKAMNILIEQGVIFQPIGDITFKFTDAILTRDYKNTSRYLREARQKGEPEIMVLSILYNGFKQILMVQGLGRDQREPVKRTGLTPWQVKMAKEKQGHYSISELIEALKIVRFVEKGIKTGQIDADVSLEYVIVNIM